MCLILFAQNQHPTYKLILAANRDEFYSRPTLPAHVWEGDKKLFAGKDLQAGGTWMGIQDDGAIAAVTNFRDLNDPKIGSRSRGVLVPELLRSGDPLKHLEKLGGNEDYSGFNLILWHDDTIRHYSNISDRITTMNDGIHGLSNHLMNTPWRKVEEGKRKLRGVIEKDDDSMVDHLFDLLQDESEAEENKLPSTGLPIELERKVSAMFIRSADYGTRCSSVILVEHDGSIHFEERSFIPEAKAVFNIK